MRQFLNLNVWVPVATVLVVLVTSGLIIVLVRHLKRKRQQRSIKRNSEAELVINREIPYSGHSLPSNRLTSDTSEGHYEIYLFEQSE